MTKSEVEWMLYLVSNSIIFSHRSMSDSNLGKGALLLMCAAMTAEITSRIQGWSGWGFRHSLSSPAIAFTEWQWLGNFRKGYFRFRIIGNTKSNPRLIEISCHPENHGYRTKGAIFAICSFFNDGCFHIMATEKFPIGFVDLSGIEESASCNLLSDIKWWENMIELDIKYVQHSFHLTLGHLSDDSGNPKSC